MEASPTSQGPGTPTEGAALPTPPLEAMDGDELLPLPGADAAAATATAASLPACPAATDAASNASSSASTCSPAGKQDPPQEKCSCCNKLTPNLRKCPCLLVSYCDPKCQVDHWPVHRSLCAAVRRSQPDKSAEGKAGGEAAAAAATAAAQAAAAAPPAAPKVDEKQQLQAQLQRALQQQQAMRAQNSYTTQQMYSGRPHMRQPLGGTDLRVLMEGIERVAATSPRSVAQIVVELIKTNPQVLAPAAFSMTKQVLAKAEAEMYSQQQQQQQQQMLSMMSRRDTATAAATASAAAAPSDLPPPPPLYSSDALKQQQALKAADMAAAQQSARMKKQQQQWSATEAAAGPSAWDAWMKSGGSASPISSASSAGRTPDRHSENTRLSTPLKSSLVCLWFILGSSSSLVFCPLL